MRRNFLAIFLMFAAVANCQEWTAAQRGCSWFLRAEFEKSDSCFSKAIEQESNNFGYFYLRATVKLYMLDTTAAVLDFNEAIRIKQSGNYTTIEDTLVKPFLSVQPLVTTPLCTPSAFEIDSGLLMIRLGAWQYLVEENKKAACYTFKQVRRLGIPQVSILLNTTACK